MLSDCLENEVWEIWEASTAQVLISRWNSLSTRTGLHVKQNSGWNVLKSPATRIAMPGEIWALEEKLLNCQQNKSLYKKGSPYPLQAHSAPDLTSRVVVTCFANFSSKRGVIVFFVVEAGTSCHCHMRSKSTRPQPKGDPHLKLLNCSGMTGKWICTWHSGSPVWRLAKWVW